MEQEEYTLICSLDRYPTEQDGDKSKLTVDVEAFNVIKRQVEHRKLRSALKNHRRELTLKRYVTRHMGDQMETKKETILDIANSVNFSPCMMARLILEAEFGWSKPAISNFFKRAHLDPVEPEYDSIIKKTINGLSPEVDAILRKEIRECIEHDIHCSPLADRIRHNIGVEYEYILLEKLRNRGLVFESEDVLREKGLSKTPDVRLLLPFGVIDRNGKLRIVNWIDSKAMFGDVHTHETENLQQVQGYVNRYGPGMVIYWFGHMKSLNSDPDIYVTNEFHDNILLPGNFDPLELVKKIEEGQSLELTKPKISTQFDEEWVPMSICTVVESPNQQLKMK